MTLRPIHSTRLLLALALLLVAVAGCGNGETDRGSGERPNQPTGIELTPHPDVSAVSLPDASNGGEPFTMVAPSNGILLVYFGYTACPDVCPTTLSDVRTAVRKLGPDADRVELAMVTIDPSRDTADILSRYVQGFVPGAHALRTDDPAALTAATEPFGARYDVQVQPDGTEEVSHTGFVYAIDPAGKVRLQWSFGTPAKDYAHDLKLLLGSSQ